MKRLASALMLVVFVLGIIPAAPAYADDGSYVTGVALTGTTYTPDDITVDFSYDSTSVGTGIGNNIVAEYKVHNSGTQASTFTVYFYFWTQVSWTSNNTLSHHVDFQEHFDFSNDTSLQLSELRVIQNCEPSQCTGGGTGYIFMAGTATTPSINAGTTMSLNFRMSQFTPTGGGSNAGTIIKHAEGSLSLVPIDGNCDDDYQQQEIYENNAIIDPLIETPVGEPTDHQFVDQDFGEGTILRLQTTDGPWNDGAASRYDTAFSYDGITWAPIEDLIGTALCVVFDPLHPELMIIIFPYAGETGDFYIRVDDLATQFADNTQVSPLLWSLASVVNATALNCADQFTYDPGTDQLASGTLAATSQSTAATTALEPGQWYVLVTSGGPWQDQEAPDPDFDRYDLAAQNSDGTWGEITGGDWGAKNCSPDTLGNYASVYFQADQATLNLSVNDVHDSLMISDGHWEDNTGSMGYTIYRAAFERFPAVCESLFDVDGADLILSGRIDANLPNGTSLTIPYDKSDQKPEDQGGTQLPVRYYMIEISGGPWHDGLLPKWGVEISGNDGTTWTNVKDFGESVITPKCSALVDNYHYRIMFAADGILKYRLRVEDPAGNFVDNTGFMLYDWFNVNTKRMEQTGPPDAAVCDLRYTHDVNPSGSITFQASNSIGVFVPGVTSVPLNIAIETTGGPWLNNGTGTSQYDVGLSDDNGVTWHLLWEYTGVQCYQQSGDENHVLIYMQAIAGRQYKVRVFDEDGNFVPNTGSMGIKVYTQTTDTMDQWTNCGDGYYGLKPIATSDANKLKTSDVLLDLIPFFFDAGNPIATAVDGAIALIDMALHVPGIPANNSSGVLLGGQILVGQDYAIQIYGGPWYPAIGTSDPSFNVEISPDNGDTWYDGAGMVSMPGVQCVLRVGPHNDEGYVRVYFTAQSGSMYRIRSDDGGVFLDNHGTMDYALFQVTQQDAILYTPGQVDDWAEACTTPPAPPEPPSAPSSAFDVTGWLSYLSGLVSNIPGWIVYSIAELKYFFLWCPEHTAALMNIPTIFADREPFATVLSILDTINKIKAEFEAMDWTNEFMPATIFTQGEGGGAEAEAPVTFLEPITDPNSPLNGGPLLTVPEGGGTTTISTAYLTHCEAGVNPILGSLFGHNACLSFAYVRQNPQVLYWIELVWEIFWIGFFIAWMINYYNRVKDVLTL